MVNGRHLILLTNFKLRKRGGSVGGSEGGGISRAQRTRVAPSLSATNH